MCGFAGIVAWEERYRVSRDVLEGMSTRIAHRGPDGQGLQVNHQGAITAVTPQVGLVHRRLAILDLDRRADQPFPDQAGRWIVFNGEIYNFRQLRAELTGLNPSYAWRTDCDTEVLLAAYDAWGEKCVEHLNGMFAFAIWDEPKKALFLARDRMGQKPLYVGVISRGDDGLGDTSFGTPMRAEDSIGGDPNSIAARIGALAFASELPALDPVAWIDRGLCPPALLHYLRYGDLPHRLSIARGIHQLAPGSTMTVMHTRWSEGCYEPRQHPPSPLSDWDAVQRTRRLVLTAVERQLVSDVPLGCFLSGGIDSSIIAAAMKAALGDGQRVLTFSIGFDDPRYDETAYAAAVAKHLGTRHQQFIIKPDAADDLPHLAAVFGEPFGDSSALPTHYLARETRRHVKVALSGDGGDELFGGYDRYRAMAISQRLRRAASPIPWMMLAPLAAAVRGGHPKSRRARALRLVRSLGLSPARRYASYMQLFDPGLIEALIAPDSAGDELARWRAIPQDSVANVFEVEHCELDVVRAALATDRRTYLPDDLLTKVDRCSMLHALEVRSPFMDHELVRFASGLTSAQLLGGGPKRMLREAFAADLPEFVFRRRKMGFAVPIGQWFRGPLRPMLRDHLFAADSFAAGHFVRKTVERLIEEHESQRVDHAQRLYALLMLELWWKTSRAH